MAVYKDKNGTWYLSVRYVNWQGEHARKVKRGFATKREATEWERSFLLENAGNLDMTFEAFVELYKKNLKERLKLSTWQTKVSIIDTKILPYFKKKRMRKNDLIRTADSVLRILAIDKERVLTIDCLKRNMPKWYPIKSLNGETFTEQGLSDLSDVEIFDIDALDSATRKIVHDRYTIIAGVLPFLTDEKMRSVAIAQIAEEHEICKQTVRNYLCLYLSFQNLSALAPKRTDDERPLSKDEKNMRWALNKFFYTKNQNSLPTACMIAMFLGIPAGDLSVIELPEYVPSCKPKGSHTNGGTKKYDWNAKDIDTLQKVIDAIASVQRHTDQRPIKISVGMVERMLGMPKNGLRNYPLCRAEIMKHVESQEQYWARELEWAAKTMLGSVGVVHMTGLMKLTNMRVRNIIASLPYLDDPIIAEKIKAVAQ